MQPVIRIPIESITSTLRATEPGAVAYPLARLRRDLPLALALIRFTHPACSEQTTSDTRQVSVARPLGRAREFTVNSRDA